MRYFQPNPNLYTVKPESFTADDEFAADKRVHITNEIPPEDLYDMVHSKLRNDFWEWFLGSTKLSYASDGIVYNLDTDGVERFDSDNNILEASIAKYVNGNRAKNYGPYPSVRFNAKTNDYELINPTYNRFEIEGTIMPEIDFLLHEGYRYLDVLYPDHPDFTEILTNNEINDDIIQAAALIHYYPNITFFDWLSQYFEYDSVPLDSLGWMQNQESLKLKIRNLRNNTFRRKLYGAKKGYQMFGAEIFQHIMIYPIAEYLPFLPKQVENKASYSEGHKKFTWFKDIYNAPDIFKNDQINKYNRLYKKVFRLVDWDNSGYDYEHQYVPPTVVYGTAYPSPLSNYDIYEWPIDRDGLSIDGEPVAYTPPSIAEDFYEGQKIQIKSGDGYRSVYINALYSEDGYRVAAVLNYDKNEFINKQYHIEEKVTRVQIDGPAYPLYTLFDVYPSVEKTLKQILDNNNAIREAYKLEYPQWLWNGKENDQFLNINSDEYSWLLDKKLKYYDLRNYDAICNDDIENKLIRSARALYGIIDNHKQVKFTLETHQDGNLFMPAQYLMTCYKNWLNVTINQENKDNPFIIYGPTSIAKDSYVSVPDLIAHNLNDESFISEIVGLEGGLLKFDIHSSQSYTIYDKPKIDNFNEEEIGKYGVVIRFHKNNEVSAGKLAVVFGRPRVISSEADKNNKYSILNLDIELQAIPKVKSHELMLALYENYENICAEKYKNLMVIFGDAKSIKDENNIYKIYHKRYNEICKQMALLLPAIEVLIKQNKDGYVHPNDTYWQKVKQPFLTILDNYDLRPILDHQITEKYNNFIKETDTTEVIKTPDEFELSCRNIIAELEKYNAAYFPWIFDIVSIDLDRSYYNTLDSSKYTDDKKVALQKLVGLDAMLDTMLINRAYLLKPMPSDVYMKTVDDEESSYSLLYQQDEFVTLLEYDLDEFKDLIKFVKNPVYGTSGVLTEFKFGSLNTASIVNNDEDLIRIPWDYFQSSEFIEDKEKWGLNYLKWYSIDEYKFITLNKDIITSVENNPEPKKFSYATPRFLELFLPQAGINNISGEIIPPYKVEIRSIITTGSNIISFIDEESILRLACISTGDRIIGNGIENDIFVDYIDYEKNQIRVKKTNLQFGEADFVFNTTDDLVLTYLCKINLFSKDTSKDFYLYRTSLSKNKLLDYGSILTHGPFDQYSQTYLNGAVDISYFINNYRKNLQSQDLFRSNFNEFVWNLYNNGAKEIDHFVIPSIINCINKLFVEIGLYKRYDIAEYDSINKTYVEKYYTDQYLIKKEVLDYFQESLDEISKGSDLVNLGVNVIAATANDGLVSRIPNEEFTDPKIKLKFATYNWSYASVPYYIDIGIGELKSFWNRTEKEFEDQKRILQDRSYYNYDVYGNKDSDSSDVGYWSKQEFSVLDLHNLPIIDRIDKPIMRVYLGEYEVQKLINFDPLSLKKYTTVQFSIIKQIFKNLEKKLRDPLVVLSENYFVHDIFKNIASFNESYINDLGKTTTYFDKSEFINYQYLGVWKPAKDIKTNKIIYPTIVEDNFNQYYYAIDDDVTLINCDINGVLTDITFNAGSVIILVYNNNSWKWEYKEFIFTGLLGTTSTLKAHLNLKETEDVTILYSYPPEFNDIDIGVTQENINSPELTLKHRLLFKLLCSMKVLNGTEINKKRFTIKEFEYIFNWTMDEIKDSTVSEYAKTHYNLHNINNLQDLYAQFIQNSDLRLLLPITEFTNIFKLNRNNIFWFLYTIGTQGTETNPSSWNLFETKTSIVNGTAFALVYINNTFKITLLSENEFLFKINSNNLEVNSQTLIDKKEFNTFIGSYGNQNNLLDYKFFLYEKLKQYQNTIDINYRYLLEGSVDIKFDIHPHFLTSGWKYNEDNTLGEYFDTLDLTENNIYFDGTNNKLYTYNLIDNKLIKVAIQQEEHKFFKNILFIYGSYSLSTIIQDNKYVQVPEISQLEGIRFDADYLSLLDRILSIEQINIRSLYNVNLESVIFSSYCDIKGIIKGIYIDNNNLSEKRYLSIGYADAVEPVLTSNKLKYVTELLKILPTGELGDFMEEDIYFNYNDSRYNAKWLENNEKILSPEVKNFTVTKNISNAAGAFFSYYKNMLVLEGEIDLFTPNYISFQKNPKLKDALSYLRIDDEIQNIYFLEQSIQDSFVDTTWSGKIAKFMDYKQDKLIIANASGFLLSSYFKNIIDVKGLVSDTLTSTVDISYNNKLLTGYNDLTSISYEKQNNRWILALAYSGSDNNIYSDLISVNLDNNISGNFNYVYNTTGHNVNTYQPLVITETNDDRTKKELLFGLDGLTDEEKDDFLEQYEFNKILSDQISGYIYARDISIVNAEISEDIFEFNSLINPNDLTPYISGYMVDQNDKVDYKLDLNGYIFESLGHLAPDKANINANAVDGDLTKNFGGIWKTSNISVKDDEYKIVELKIKKIINDGDSFSDTSLTLGCYDNVAQMWVYDKITEKWTLATATLYNHNFLNGYNIPQTTNVICYIAGYKYGIDETNGNINNINIVNSTDNIGMGFWRLPRPEVTDNSVVCAFIINNSQSDINSTKLKITINRGTTGVPGRFLLSELKVKTPKYVNGSSFVEGPYNPNATYDLVENKLSKFSAKKWVAYNQLDEQVIVIGSTLFIYNQTQTYQIKTYQNDYNQTVSGLFKEGLTEFNHWKRAELPSTANITYELFNKVEQTLRVEKNNTGTLSDGLLQVYDLVSSNHEYIKNLLQQRISALSSSLPDSSDFAELTAFQIISDWIEKNPPQKYITEEEIPIVIEHNGVEVLYTEKGKIPNFKAGAIIRWQAPQDILIEMGLTSLVYLKKQNYLRYLADYYSIILGSQRFKQFFDNSNIKDVTLTNTDLIFRTTLDDLISISLEYTHSREDIENYNNWHISNIGENYIFSANIAGQYTERMVGINDTYLSIEQFPIQETVKAFTILEKYVNNNVHIYAGYIQVNNAVMGIYDAAKQTGSLNNAMYLTKLFPNNLNNTELNDGNRNENWEFSQAKYPIIFYSTDGGKHFSQWKIPQSESRLLGDISTFTLKGSGDVINNPHFEACQIYQIGSEIRISIRTSLRTGTESWSEIGYVSCFVSKTKSSTEILFNDMLTLYSNEELEKVQNNNYLRIVRNHELFAGVDVYYTTDKDVSNEISETDINSSTFYLKKPFSFNLTDKPKISKIDDAGVQFNFSNDLDLESENLRVLVSINPYNLLENNTTYLDYKTEYLNSFGQLAVPLFIEVSNIDQANRLYSQRECMAVMPAGETDPSIYPRNSVPRDGIPAISEDTEHRVFQYYDPFVNSKGETIIKYKEAYNTANQIVKLCRSNGDYLTVLDSPTNNNYYTLASLILNNISYESLVPAPILQDEYEAVTTDTILQPILLNTLNRKVTVHYLNFTNNNPQLNLHIQTIDNIIKQMIDEKLFYEAPIGYTSIKKSDTEDDSKFYLPSYNNNEFWDDWAVLRRKIENIDGPFDMLYKRASLRFEIIALETSSLETKYFFFDLFTNTIPLKEQNNIIINFNVPYQFKNGQQVYNNYTFNLLDDHHTLDKYEESYPITSIFIPSKGYGGSLNNISWDKIRPEENDYLAFDFDDNKNPYLSINDKGDYIYLSDQEGVKLFSRNGLDWFETDSQVEISYNKLFAEKQQVKFYENNRELEYDCYQNDPIIYNFYKLPLNPIDIFTPKRFVDENEKICGKVWLNNPCLRDSSNNAYLTNDNKYKIPVTLLKLSKSGKTVDSNDYEFTFYDIKGIQLDRFIYDYNSKMIYYAVDSIYHTANDNYYPVVQEVPQLEEKIIVNIKNIKINQETQYDLYIQSGKEQGLVLSMTEIYFNNKSFLDNERNIIITFDEATIIKAGLPGASNIISNDQTLNLNINNTNLNSNILKIDFVDYPLIDYILFNNEPLYLDIRNYNIQVLTNRDWISSVNNDIEYYLYTGDQLLQEKYLVEMDDTDPNYLKAVYYNGLEKYLFDYTIKIENKEQRTILIDDYIYTWNNNDIETEKKYHFYIKDDQYYFDTRPDIMSDVSTKILISSLPSNIIMNYPKYKNFKDLIDNKLQIIEYKNPRILAVEPIDNNIIEIDPNYISFKLKNEIDFDTSSPYLKIKILPVQTVYPETRYLNNENYIHEVDILEKDVFGYDRVWINENLVSSPPIIYRKFFYNESADYYTNSWLNKDGYMIYLCDHNGKFVRPALVNGLLKYLQIDENNDGDCRPYIYGNVDPRFNLPELILKTSIEKYKNDYYIEGLEINPLVLTLNIKDEYNVITQRFDKITNIYSKKRADNTIKYIQASDDLYYISKIGQNILYEIKDKIYQNKYDNYFDYENGQVKFTLRGPNKEYKLNEVKYFYGIKYSVNKNLIDNLKIKTNIDNDIRSSFYINTKEDLTDKKNKDHAIVEITEIGLFDKYNHLCAYLSHPKIQYRSDSTHLSYSLIIEEN
jgi:hypothetical protein